MDLSETKHIVFFRTHARFTVLDRFHAYVRRFLEKMRVAASECPNMARLPKSAFFDVLCGSVTPMQTGAGNACSLKLNRRPCRRPEAG